MSLKTVQLTQIQNIYTVNNTYLYCIFDFQKLVLFSLFYCSTQHTVHSKPSPKHLLEQETAQSQIQCYKKPTEHFH